MKVIPVDFTVLFTVLSGVLTYVVGQLIVKLFIEPVQDARRTIGQISHSMIEYANIIANPGVLEKEVNWDASRHLRKLSSELQSHLYLVPAYDKVARLFVLPSKDQILIASKSLIGLSNSLHSAAGDAYDRNAAKVEKLCDALSIYVPDDDRVSKLSS